MRVSLFVFVLAGGILAQTTKTRADGSVDYLSQSPQPSGILKNSFGSDLPFDSFDDLRKRQGTAYAPSSQAEAPPAAGDGTTYNPNDTTYYSPSDSDSSPATDTSAYPVDSSDDTQPATDASSPGYSTSSDPSSTDPSSTDSTTPDDATTTDPSYSSSNTPADGSATDPNYSSSSLTDPTAPIDIGGYSVSPTTQRFKRQAQETAPQGTEDDGSYEPTSDGGEYEPATDDGSDEYAPESADGSEGYSPETTDSEAAPDSTAYDDGSSAPTTDDSTTSTPDYGTGYDTGYSDPTPDYIQPQSDGSETTTPTSRKLRARHNAKPKRWIRRVIKLAA